MNRSTNPFVLGVATFVELTAVPLVLPSLLPAHMNTSRMNNNSLSRKCPLKPYHVNVAGLLGEDRDMEMEALLARIGDDYAGSVVC